MSKAVFLIRGARVTDMMPLKSRIFAVSREKKFAKPLDKSLQVCYTIITKRKENLPNQKGLIL